MKSFKKEILLGLNMGKIKSKMMRRTAESFMKDEDIEFSEDFEKNKKILGDTMPSKKLRNRIAGLISRMKRQEAKKKAELASE
jgi:ribosomal protein S17E